jgi:hypothetical protein
VHFAVHFEAVVTPLAEHQIALGFGCDRKAAHEQKNCHSQANIPRLSQSHSILHSIAQTDFAVRILKEANANSLPEMSIAWPSV